MSVLDAPARTSPRDWHPPLVALAVVMALSSVICLLAAAFDHRTLGGQPIWFKPLKFSLSIGIYAVSWAWMIGQMDRFRRPARWAGTIAAGFLLVEQGIIVLAVLRATSSHFNVSTPLDAALWSVMAGSIATVWAAMLLTSVLLFAVSFEDRARALAIRLGAVIAVIGMALGFLMTMPTAAQLAGGAHFVGAHTVGLPDGGPGLPFLGWSTVGGDLRIPHFVGLHALQVLPLLLILIEATGRRSARLAREAVRVRLVIVTAAAYLTAMVLLTWQALRGQSVIHPDRQTLEAVACVLAACVLGVVWSVRAARPWRKPSAILSGTRSRRTKRATG